MIRLGGEIPPWRGRLRGTTRNTTYTIVRIAFAANLHTIKDTASRVTSVLLHPKKE